MKRQGVFEFISRSPILWGSIGFALFYGLVFYGPLNVEIVKRYFTHHPVEYMLTGLFAVGMAALLIKMFEFLGERAMISRSPWSELLGDASTAGAADLLAALKRLPESRQSGMFVGRLIAALDVVRRRGTAEGLDDELKFLSDADAERVNAGFALFRVIVWAIPILGFLGTVIGITMALNSLNSGNAEQSMMEVLKGLGLKFDTTALALTLSMALMFVHFYADRLATALLFRIDERVTEELSGRFESVPNNPQGQLDAMRRMTEALMHLSEQMTQKQVSLWQSALAAAEESWGKMTQATGARLEGSMSVALREGMQQHAQQLAAIEQNAMQQTRQNWERFLQTQSQAAQTLTGVQSAVTHQVEVIRGAVEAAGDVMRLEDALNRNLNALAGAKHFEQTVNSLAAAIHLLNARLAELPAMDASVQLESRRRASQAA